MHWYGEQRIQPHVTSIYTKKHSAATTRVLLVWPRVTHASPCKYWSWFVKVLCQCIIDLTHIEKQHLFLAAMLPACSGARRSSTPCLIVVAPQTLQALSPNSSTQLDPRLTVELSVPECTVNNQPLQFIQ